MSVLKVELVVGSEHVAGNHRGEDPAVLLAVAAVHHVQHPLGVGVAKVGRVRGSVVNLDRGRGSEGTLLLPPYLDTMSSSMG